MDILFQFKNTEAKVHETKDRDPLTFNKQNFLLWMKFFYKENT